MRQTWNIKPVTVGAVATLAVAVVVVKRLAERRIDLLQSETQGQHRSNPGLSVPPGLCLDPEVLWGPERQDLIFEVVNGGDSVAVEVQAALLPWAYPHVSTGLVRFGGTDKVLTPGEMWHVTLRQGGIVITTSHRIAGELFHAADDGLHKARLTITWRDLAGRKYATILDVTNSGELERVVEGAAVERDLVDISLENARLQGAPWPMGRVLPSAALR